MHAWRNAGNLGRQVDAFVKPLLEPGIEPPADRRLRAVRQAVRVPFLIGPAIDGLEAARAQGMKVITLTGKDGGKMAGSADVEIRVPHFGYADRIQEIHIKVIHILIMLIEKEMVKA